MDGTNYKKLLEIGVLFLSNFIHALINKLSDTN